MKKYMIILINSALLFLSAGIYTASFIKKEWARAAFSYGGYYIIFVMVLLWALFLAWAAKYYKINAKGFFKSNLPGIIAAGVLCVITAIAVKPSFKVLCDEANLLSVSKSMFYEKKTDNVTMGKWYYDNYYPFNIETEKRPMLFPFFTQIIHAVSGYRVENVFVLNSVVLFMLLLLVYTIMKYFTGNIWALSAVILVASQPLVTILASSGGFDLFAALFIIICFMCLWWFLKEPTAMKFQILYLSLLMAVHIRHEGLLMFITVIGMLFLFRYVKSKYITENGGIIFALTPLLLLPIFWQRILIQDPFEANKGELAFAFEHFFKHSLVFFQTLFNVKYFLPYAGLVNLIGFMGLLWAIYKFIMGDILKEQTALHLAAIISCVLMVYWIFFTSFYRGIIDHPSCARYFIIFYIALPLLAVYFLTNFSYLKYNAYYGIIFSISMFLMYNSVTSEDRFSRTQTLPRMHRFVMRTLSEEAKKNPNLVVIDGRPVLYTIYNFGSVNFDYANNDSSIADGFKQKLFENIYVVQEIEYKTNKPSKDTTLSPKFRLRPLAEGQNNVEFYVRVSKVIGIRE